MTADVRRSALVVLATGHGLNAMAGGFLYPFFAVYLGGRAAGRGALAVGLTFALATLLSAAGRILGGEMADRRGRRVVLLASVAGRSTMLLLLALAVVREAPLLLIVAPFLLSSIARGAYEPAADAMVADAVSPERRVRAYAVMRIARNAGWALGPALGGLLEAGRFPVLAAIAALLGFVSLFVSLRFLVETPHTSTVARFHPRDLALALRDPVFRRHCVLTAGLFILFAQLLVSVSIDLASRARLTSQEMGWIYTLNGVMVVALQSTVTRLASGPPGRVLALGALVDGIGYLLIGLATGLPMAILGIAVFTLGEMMTLPLSAAVAADIAPADRRGRYLGAYGVFMDLGHGVGQVVGGLGLSWAGPEPLRFWGAIMALAVVVALGYLRFGVPPARD